MRTLMKKPVIQYPIELAKKSQLSDKVVVATDSDEIGKIAVDLGVSVFASKIDSHITGTDRICEAAATENFDIIVNVQADEVFFPYEYIDKMIVYLRDHPNISAINLLSKIKSGSDLCNPNIVKACMNCDSEIVYYTRKLDQQIKLEVGLTVYKQIGIYAFRKETLNCFVRHDRGRLEIHENVEMIRLLENNIPISGMICDKQTIDVNTQSDLHKAIEFYSKKSFDKDVYETHI